jgi:hypothetical protein
MQGFSPRATSTRHAASMRATLPQLQRGMALSERLLLMGVGWLARKHKLSFVQERGVVKLALQEQLTAR